MRLILAALAAVVLLTAPAQGHVPGVESYLKAAVAAFPTGCHVTVSQEPMDHAGVAYMGECRIAFPTRGVHRWPAWQTCAVTFHEVGHLHGFGHSDDPDSLMYPVIRRPYWRCRALTKER